jgi:hypothetical protein
MDPPVGAGSSVLRLVRTTSRGLFLFWGDPGVPTWRYFTGSTRDRCGHPYLGVPRTAQLTFRSPSVSLHGAVRGTRQGRRSCPQGLALTRWPGLYAFWADEREGGGGEGIALDINPVTPHLTVRFTLAQWWEALGQPLQNWRCRVLSPQLVGT